MDEIRPPRRQAAPRSTHAVRRSYGRDIAHLGNRQGSVQPVALPQLAAVPPTRTKVVDIRIRLAKPKVVRWVEHFYRRVMTSAIWSKIARLYKSAINTKKKRIGLVLVAAVMLLSAVLPVLQTFLDHKIYALSPGENAVLLATNKSMADKLKLDTSEQAYMFNQGYTPANPADDIRAGGSLIRAQINQDPKKGIDVTDPINNVDFTIKPLFDLGAGKQQQNRVVFPAFNGGGHLVYTAGAVGVKQEVTLQHEIGDNLKYSYQMDLGDQYAAHLESNGSIGIYGSSLPITGNVSTSDAKDAALLKKARQKAVKDKLLFTLPAPTIKESYNHVSDAHAKYVLNGDKLDVVVEHLKDASYPLSIDPTVTATGVLGLFSFDANIETNVYVDTSNNFFERSPLTGGNLSGWNASSSTAAAHFLGSAVVYGGTLYVIGGASTTTTTNLTGTNYVEQAVINSSGTVGTFHAGNSTGLPAGGISRFQLLSYNGYLYIIDGSTTDTTGATLSNAVYYTRVTSESFAAFSYGAQLVNWSNTTTNVPKIAGVATPRYDYGATVYNGSLYIAGGRTGTAYTSGLVSDVSYSAILPNGAPGAWTSTTALPAARFGTGMQAYNGHLYVVGGNLGGGATGGTLTETVLYSSIASDGSIADTSWKSTNSLENNAGTAVLPVENLGQQLTMIYNGYLYITGGCTTINLNQACTAVSGDSQLAQINADGSLGSFFPNDFASTATTTSLPRVGTPTFGYNGNMYSIAGCSAMPTTGVSCNTTSLTSNYTPVNATVGDISANRTPTALPVGLFAHASVVLNGFIYIIGGCLAVACGSTAKMANYTTYYNTIAADGSLGVSWTTNTVATNATSLHFDGNNASNCTNAFSQCGLAGLSAVTYNGFIYVLGGNDGNAYNAAVYYQQPNASTGAPTTWTKGTNSIFQGATGISAFAQNGSLYVMGGCLGSTGIGCASGTGTAFSTQVQRSVITAGVPGAWTSTTTTPPELQLSIGIGATAIAVYGNYIYLSGGVTSAIAQTTAVLRAKINSSGDIVAATGSAWTATTGSMAKARRRAVSYVVNGYLYIIGGHNGADTTQTPNGTTYGDVQIGKMDLSTGGTGDIASFTQSASSTLTQRWNPAIAFANGFMYVTGGCTVGYPAGNCTTAGTIDESFVVYDADNLGLNTVNSPTHYYSSGANGDTSIANRVGAGAVAYNGYLYVAGGCATFVVSTLACSLATTDTVYAPIKSDGTLGTWLTGPTLPALYAFNQLVAVNGTLYILTGENSSGVAKSIVRYSVIGASGLPGTWTDATNSLPITLTRASAVVYADRIYVAGGFDNSSGLNQNKVYVSPPLPSGGDITATRTCPDTSVASWCATTSSFTTARRELSLVSAGAFLFVIGGFDGTNYLADVQVATPNTSTGDITSWSFDKEIPYKEAGMSAVGANGYIYTFGGRNGVASTSCTNHASFAAVNANGTVSDWQQPANVLASARFGTALAYSNGFFFVNGGDDCTNILSSTVIQQSGQLSEAVHATYTRYVDFGTDATFRQLYVLGTNAQISGVDIDRWKIIVKTSTRANNTWGVKTNFTLTGLNTGPAYGTPMTFQALDASGVDQGAAQYWDITFDIDQAQSFNFPDSNQPQITKYDFYFSPGPGKRLRDGKTFVNEQQTTLDAHP